MSSTAKQPPCTSLRSYSGSDRIRQLLATRRWCYVIPAEGFVEGHGFRVSIAIEREAGHYPTGSLAVLSDDKAIRSEAYAAGHSAPYFWGMTYEAARVACIEANARIGISEMDAALIVATTMTGSPRAERARARRSRTTR